MLCDNLGDKRGGRERQEGGDICVLVADAHCYMAESIQHCKAIILQLKINLKKENYIKAYLIIVPKAKPKYTPVSFSLLFRTLVVAYFFFFSIVVRISQYLILKKLITSSFILYAIKETLLI